MATDNKNGRPVNILLIEDKPGDIMLTRDALEKAEVPTRVAVARDGEEALRYLRREGEFAGGAVKPDVILLDLNLPRLDGREVLEEIKNDEALRAIPVIVLTSSASHNDVMQTYTRHVNCYIVKPVDYTRFTQVVEAINLFWLQVVQLPTFERPGGGNFAMKQVG